MTRATEGKAMTSKAKIMPAGDRQQCLIEPEDSGNFAHVNSQPFTFRHRLHVQSLFTLEDVIAMSRRLPDGDAFKCWQNGKVGIADGWDTRPEERLSLEETLEGLMENDGLVLFKHVEQDKVFGPVLQDILQEMFDYAPRAFRDEVIVGEALVFLNSPGRLTPYHFDLESSFLLQVQGEKTAFAWPYGDSTLVTDGELEEYCGAGNFNAAVYKPERQNEAQVFKLGPGDGIHFPSVGPHCVQNGDSLSISVNINYEVRSLHRNLQNSHRFNRRLQRLGLPATKPGRYPVLDGMKATAWDAVLAARRSVQAVTGRKDAVASYPVWHPQR
ncbi:hypothetical protein [Novosphingobium malaysiense]|uniref:hypothetical protein n=1 Tax=Novosphingobium malaysiense TaxID=1348853 RepID=UPI000691247A|nr:hypothetical protein [Novosphingobium malaysiense]